MKINKPLHIEFADDEEVDEFIDKHAPKFDLSRREQMASVNEETNQQLQRILSESADTRSVAEAVLYQAGLAHIPKLPKFKGKSHPDDTELLDQASFENLIYAMASGANLTLALKSASLPVKRMSRFYAKGKRDFEAGKRSRASVFAAVIDTASSAHANMCLSSLTRFMLTDPRQTAPYMLKHVHRLEEDPAHDQQQVEESVEMIDQLVAAFEQEKLEAAEVENKDFDFFDEVLEPPSEEE